MTTEHRSGVWVWRLLSRALAWRGTHSGVVAAALDAGLMTACWHLGYLFRMGVERWQPARPWYDDYVLLVLVVVHLALLMVSGIYRMPWRYFGFPELARIFAVVVGVGILSGAVVVGAGLSGVARSVLVLHPVFCIVALSMWRMLVRLLWERSQAEVNAPQNVQNLAVVLGAQEATAGLLKSIAQDSRWKVTAVFDDQPACAALRALGVSVAGRFDDALHSRQLAQAQYVFVAVPAARADDLRRAEDVARRAGKTVIRLPEAGEAEAPQMASLRTLEG